VELDDVFGMCREKARHGDLWRYFTVEELLWYAEIKVKRARLFWMKQGNTEKMLDDAMDAVNIVAMAVMRNAEDV